ncbi:MAG: indole-3-glycerol phosphate synthase TrpC [Elusimicrobia bacterium]|nr:indole-3-glycerol phosphate synthase TrpC [Elusimicrobiota bacterium]
MHQTLEKIIAAKKKSNALKKKSVPQEALVKNYPANRRRFALHQAITRDPSVSIIAEYKRASPSAGKISDADPVAMVRAYTEGGAHAVSVLTEEDYFNGSLDDLRLVRQHTELPVLRKDFIIDPYQIHESVAAGADAVLLIARICDQALLAAMLKTADQAGIDALVEVHDEDDMRMIQELPVRLIGINNRDLNDFTVDPHCVERLVHLSPHQAAVVAESGIETPDDIAALKKYAVSAVLVGASLMRSEDPAAMVRALREAGNRS